MNKGARMRMLDDRTGRVVLTDVTVAATPWQRARGLLGVRVLPFTAGMYFPECRMIHTCGMRMTIDVVYLDRAGCVRELDPHLRPWRLSFCRCAAGRHTLETAAGAIARLGIKIGDRLRLDHG